MCRRLAPLNAGLRSGGVGGMEVDTFEPRPHDWQAGGTGGTGATGGVDCDCVASGAEAVWSVAIYWLRLRSEWLALGGFWQLLGWP